MILTKLKFYHLSLLGAGDAIVDLIKSFAGVVEKAGSLVNKIADISNSTEVRRAGDEVNILN